MRCRVCNSYIPEGATHCIECGNELELFVICQRCGASTSPSARFCRKCGAKITAPPENPSGSGIVPSSENFDKRTCFRCGGKVPLSNQYCPACGTNINAVRKQQTETRTTEIQPVNRQEDVKPPPQPVVPIEVLLVNTDAGICPRCGTMQRGSGRFCYQCGRFMGTDIEDIICAECGSTNILRYARCQYCGAGLPPPKSGGQDIKSRK